MIGISVALGLMLGIPIVLLFVAAYLYRRWVTSIECHLLCNDGSEKLKRIKETKRTVEIGEGSYTFDSQDVYHRGIRRAVYFLEGNPKAVPLNPDMLEGKPGALKLTPEEFNDHMKETILGIFTGAQDKQVQLLKLVVGLSVFLSVVVIIIAFSVMG